VDAGPESEATPDVPGVGRLEFVDEWGDDQESCADADVCSLDIAINNERTLRVRYLVDGVPRAGAPLSFQVEDDPFYLAHVACSTVYTQTDGIAATRLKVYLDAGGCLVETFRVRVGVYGRPEVAPLFFSIRTGGKCDAYLTVSFDYDGAKPFDGVTVYLFKSVQPTAADLACAALDPLVLPSADQQKGPVQVSQTAKFNMLPGLEVEQEQFYTIIALGELMDGTRVTFGCNDTDGHVKVTSSTHVVVTLEDLM
jgi:hypothetical protein